MKYKLLYFLVGVNGFFAVHNLINSNYESAIISISAVVFVLSFINLLKIIDRQREVIKSLLDQFK